MTGLTCVAGTYDTLLLSEPEPGIALVTLHRPDRHNAMTMAMFDELERFAWAVDADDECRVVVLTGAGDTFCPGYDLADAGELAGLGALGMLDRQERAARAMLAIRSVRVPLIAAINGAAAGGGLSLALAADIRLAARTAKFNAAFVRIGLSAGDLGCSWLLTRLVGPGMSSELCFTGRLVDADEAAAIRLVNAVHEPDRLLPEALALAAQIIGNSPTGVQLSKRALQANMEVGSYATAIELENRGQALLTRTTDMAEALSAFRDRRPPVYTGQ